MSETQEFPGFNGTVRQATLAETIALITNTRNYGELALTRPDFSTIYQCIDPRALVRAVGKRLKIAHRLAGGGGGVVDIRATAETAISGEVVSFDDALEEEKIVRGPTSLGGHQRCGFLVGAKNVKQEEANPSDQTSAAYEETLYRFNRDRRVVPLLPRLSEAAGAQLDNWDMYGLGPQVLDTLDESFSQHKNIDEVFGENQALAYVASYSHTVGFDLNSKAKLLAQGIDAQFYFETRGANAADLVRTYELSTESIGRKGFDMLFGSFVLHACATETVLTRDHEVVKIEVDHSPHGLQIAPAKGHQL